MTSRSNGATSYARPVTRRRPAPAVPLVLSRSFDDGGPVAARVVLRREYDLGAPPASTTPGAREDSTAEYDVAAHNPGFRLQAPAEPIEEAKPGGSAVPPPAAASSPAGPLAPKPIGTPSGRGAPTAAETAFTQRQLEQLITDEALRADLQSIAQGKSDPGGRAAAATGAATPAAPAATSGPGGADRGRAGERPAQEDPHAVFRKIAEDMRYATAYDLGSIELERRFDDFERLGPPARPLPVARARSVPAEAAAPTGPAPAAKAEPARVPAHPHADDSTWPPPPTGLTRYEARELPDRFGKFEYEPTPTAEDPRAIRILGSWQAGHIVRVSIPQLTGKKDFRGEPFASGFLDFHKDGRDAVARLFEDWEKAGLLDRIESCEGAFVPRFVGGTTTLSPHAFGVAFDINAKSNPQGSTPALAGAPGSVRELVEIANRHGFCWGGHFSGSRVDGMHFELGKPA